MKQEEKKRLFKAFRVVGIIAAAVIGYALFVNVAGFGMNCIIKSRLGIECPGCGMSRAAAALLRLDLASAFAYNAIWPVYTLYIIWAGVYITYKYIKHGQNPALPRPMWINYVTATVVLGYGVLRNFI